MMPVPPLPAGKTASLKALGLAALMAKAGLFLPQAPGAAEPRLLWFDKARRRAHSLRFPPPLTRLPANLLALCTL